ncbi:MAG: nucleotidyltransferase domain-containing protein [Bacteroidia bacterium]|nr:nucleotidyltransferase domain-containing protein [Bacteroidia bacterium]
MTLQEQVKTAILQIEPGASVVMFGSRARGDARPNSDWDFLILTDLEVDHALKRSIWNQLYTLELHTGEVIHSLIAQRDAWEKSDSWPIRREITKEGQVL